MNPNDEIEKKQKKINKEDIVDDELLEDEEYELVEEDDFEELPDDEEYELVEDDEEEEAEEVLEDDEEYELVEDAEEEEAEEVLEDDEEYELVEDDEEEEAEEVLEDAEEYELVEDAEEEEAEEVLEDDEEYELVDDDETEEVLEDDEEYELVEDAEEEEAEEVLEDDEEYELVEDDEEEEAEEVLEDDEEYELVEDDEEEEAEEVLEDAEEYELVDDDEEEEAEEVLEDDEEYELVDDEEEEAEEVLEDDEEYELVDNDEEAIEVTNESIDNETAEEPETKLDSEGEAEENEKTDDSEESENGESEKNGEDEEIEESEEESEDEESEEDTEEEEEGIYPDELIDIELECIYLGLLFNNPRAISRFYFLYEDCQFSDNELTNLYKIVLFRDGEQFAPAQAKNKYQLPRETPNTYDLKMKVRRIAAAKEYSLEQVYVKLKKLFILKKNYLVAATEAIREKILEIQNYELYADMTVEEVESALEQITVTTGLSQGRLNEGATQFLLAGDNELSNGISIPFNILSTVFKGLRKGETMTYAMPSNSGKSRFTLNLASYIAYVHKEKVLIISNEMAEDKMKLCMITTILNNPEIQKLHGQEIRVSEGELLELKFRPDKGKKVKCDEKGYILRKEGESQEEFIDRLKKNSTVFNQTLKVTEWVNQQVNNSIYFIHITEHTNEDLRKIIMNYYYKEGIHYMFYDTLKADTANIGNSDEVKKTATILSNLAQKFRIFIASSMQLLESTTLPVNLTVNDMSASKTVKEVLDTLCLIKQISRATINKYEYSDTDQFDKCYEIDVPKDTDVRFYACVVDKNRAGAKPTVLFKLNLAYNEWHELGYLRLKQNEEEVIQTMDRA